MKPPVIPVTPQQKRRRRKNLLFIGISSCAALATLGYLYQEEVVEGVQSFIAELQGTADDANANAEGDTIALEAYASTVEGATAAAAGDDAQSGNAPGRSSERSKAYDAASDSSKAKTPKAPKAKGATPAHRADGASSEDEGEEEDAEDGHTTPQDASDHTEPNNSGYTDEELARLPAWQAAFVRLEPQQRVEFAATFTRAKAAYNAEQWTGCLALLDKCEAIFADSPNVSNLRACALLSINELEQAEPCINRSLQLNPNDSVALMCLAELHMLKQDFRRSIDALQRLRNLHQAEGDRALYDAFTFHQLLCHLMLRQEMEARALVAGLSPICDSPLYYYSEAAFCVYRGDGTAALTPLRSASNIFGNGGTTSSYRKWMSKCGLADKYVRNKRH